METYRQLMNSEPSIPEHLEHGAPLTRGILGGPGFVQRLPRRIRSRFQTVEAQLPVHLIVHHVAKLRGLRVEEILYWCKERRLVLARALIAWYATEDGGATLSDVARVLHRDVSHSVSDGTSVSASTSETLLTADFRGAEASNRRGACGSQSRPVMHCFVPRKFAPGRTKWQWDAPRNPSSSKQLFTGKTLMTAQALPHADPDDLNPTDRVLVALWNEVLQLPRPPRRTDNFFSQGGDSMAAVTLEFRITEELSVQLSPGTLFGAPTLGELSRVIARLIAKAHAPKDPSLSAKAPAETPTDQS